jgi:hypothetical protein
MTEPEVGPRSLTADTRCGNILIGVGFLAAIAIHWWLFAGGVYALSADSSVRILNAWYWSLDPSIAGVFEATIPPPLYRLVMGTALLVWPDPFWAPRAVTFVLGLGALAALCWLSHELFRNRMMVGLTAVIGAALPARALLALVPLAGILYLVLATTALAATLRWLRTRRTGPALAAAALFGLASAVRYEGWFFSAVFGALVLIRWRRGGGAGGLTWRSVVGIAVILAAFPCAWLLIHQAQHGSLEWITGATGPRFELRFGDSFWKVLPRSLPAVFLTQNLATLDLLGLVSIVLVWRRHRLIRFWLALPAAALVVLSTLALVSMAVPSHNFWRIPAIWSMLLVPFAAHWLLIQGRIAGRLGRRMVIASVAIPVVLVLAAGILEISRLTVKPNFVRAELSAARRIEKLLDGADDDQMVLIDSSRMRYFHIRTASRKPDRFVLNTGRDPRSPSPPFAVDVATGAVRVHKMIQNRIRYAMFIDIQARTMLDAHPRMKPINRFGRWTIYELVDPKPRQDPP